jgi:hypothetical protein
MQHSGRCNVFDNNNTTQYNAAKIFTGATIMKCIKRFLIFLIVSAPIFFLSSFSLSQEKTALLDDINEALDKFAVLDKKVSIENMGATLYTEQALAAYKRWTPYHTMKIQSARELIQCFGTDPQLLDSTDLETLNLGINAYNEINNTIKQYDFEWIEIHLGIFKVKDCAKKLLADPRNNESVVSGVNVLGDYFSYIYPLLHKFADIALEEAPDGDVSNNPGYADLGDPTLASAIKHRLSKLSGSCSGDLAEITTLPKTKTELTPRLLISTFDTYVLDHFVLAQSERHADIFDRDRAIDALLTISGLSSNKSAYTYLLPTLFIQQEDSLVDSNKWNYVIY